MLADATPPVELPAHGPVNTTTLLFTAQPWACPGGTIVELRAIGEIDQLTCPALLAALAGVGPDSAHLVVDLAGVTFCCVRGFALLADTDRAATAAGTGFAISGLPPHLARYAAMLWADAAPIRCYRSAAAAVSAIRVEQAAQHPA